MFPDDSQLQKELKQGRNLESRGRGLMTGPLSLLSYNTQDSLSRSATLPGKLGPSALVIY